MNAPRDFSDETLTAYLDQEADPELVRDIETALTTDSNLVARLAALRFPKDALADAFGQQLTAAPAMPSLPPKAETTPITANLPEPPRWGFLSGAVSGLAAGFLGAVFLGWSQFFAPEEQQPGWLDVVANYQGLYVPETLNLRTKDQNANGSAEQDLDLAALSEAVGADLSVLKSVEGLAFKRAQQLGFRGKTLIQIAYTLPDGTPVAICILPSGNQQSGPRSQVLSGMAASDWTTGTHGVLIIGGDDQTIIDGLAEKVQPLI